MKVKIKKLHKDAVIPKYAKPGDAGMDLTAISADIDFFEDRQVTYKTGIAIEIPEGYVGLIYPRSSICKKDLYLTNAVGVIDSQYRGEIIFKFNIDSNFVSSAAPEIYAVGDRIGQLIIMPYPKIELEEVEELSSSERGTGGFGHTGS